MRAWLSVEAGGPESLVLSDTPTPAPAEGEIVVAVRACGINFFDSLIIQDRYQLKPPRPFSPGAEWAGVVAQVGAGVTRLKTGDHVLGAASYGALAEFVAAPESSCRLLPEGMPFSDGAGYQTAFGTSYYSLRHRGQISPGQTLLVLGAAGGVGAAAVQLGKAFGARVLAQVSTEEKAAFVRSQGADDVVVLSNGTQASAAFKALCGADGADIIFDPVGGALAEAALRSLSWNGRYLIVGFTGGIPSFPLNLPLLKHAAILGCRWGAFARADPKTAHAYISELDAMLARGLITPSVTQTYPFLSAPEAIAHLGSRQAIGKVVVNVSEN